MARAKGAPGKKKEKKKKKRASSGGRKQTAKKTSRKRAKPAGRGARMDHNTVEIRKMLLEKRKALLKGASEKYAEARERSLAGGDVSDRAASAADGDLALRLAEGDVRQIARIDGALRRIGEGTYGLCEECKGRIPAERLKIRPFSVHCVKCQTKLEREQKAGGGEGGLAWGDIEEEGGEP